MIYPSGSLADSVKNQSIIFAHEVRNVPGNESLSKSIGSFEKNSERSLVMARPKRDVVLLNKRPDPTYIKYLHKIGLGPRKIISFNSHDLVEGIKNDRHLPKDFLATYSPYYSSDKELSVAKQITDKALAAPEEIILKYYDKASFKDVCVENDVEVPQGEVFKRTLNRENDIKRLKSIITKHLDKTGEVLIRETGLASGISMESVDKNNIDEVAERLMKSGGRKFLVEAKEHVLESPSIIGYIANNQLVMMAQTSQLLSDKLFYLGNMIDYTEAINPQMAEIFNKVGNNMLKDGYVGAFGIDFIRTKDERYMPVECNARITGAFFPHELRQRLAENGNKFDVSMSFTTKVKPYDTFKEFVEDKNLRELLYKGDGKPGIIPFNVSSMKEGKFTGIVVANSQEEAMSIKSKFEK